RINPKNNTILSSGSIPSLRRASALLTFSPKLSYKGWGTNCAGFPGSMVRRSPSTFSLIVIKASTGFKKYRVKAVSPGLFSCGMILSAIHTILVCLFFLTILSMVPRQGPMKGSQYLTTIMSGAIFFSSLPALYQLKGLMELMRTCIFSCAGGGSEEYCVVPGKRKPGYCNENV